MRASLPTAAVIFDCDGVLVNSEEIAQDVEMAMLAELGLEYDRREYMTRFMGTGEDAWWRGLETDAMARLGRSIRGEFEARLNVRMRAELKARLAEIPGAAVAVSRVHQLRAVASSSGTRSLRRKLKAVGHWSLFAPHVYSADDVALPKPAPDLFLHAAARLGIDAAQCVVIEDSINGVRAGLAAGMRVWGFIGGRHHSHDSGADLIQAGAERVVADWTEAAALFDQLR